MTAPAPLSSLRVLIADDYPDCAEALAVILPMLIPCTVDVCRDGGEAIQRALLARPHAVILDLDMPVVGGVEAAFWIKSAYDDPVPVVLAITGNAEALARVPPERTPFSRTFLKPVDPTHVAQALKQACLGAA